MKNNKRRVFLSIFFLFLGDSCGSAYGGGGGGGKFVTLFLFQNEIVPVFQIMSCLPESYISFQFNHVCPHIECKL